MTAAFVALSPSPGAEAPPRGLVMPGEGGVVHPLARHAATALLGELRTRALLPEVDFDIPGAGKMFGVLVVETPRGLGYLRAFSGMIARSWFVDGFAPPLFDRDALAAIWPAGEAELDAMTDRIATLEGAARRELMRRRAERSRALWRQIQATYRIADAQGHARTLAELFAPRQAPSGAGDCAAPKLLGWAFALGLRPLALAELWWGAPRGARRAGQLCAPCEGKCGPVLAHMLRGL